VRMLVMTMELLANEVELVPELRQRLTAAKELKKPETALKVLDIGCGSGKLAIYLQEATGCEVTGIDPVEKNVEKARLKSSSVTFMVQSAEEMTFADNTFDCAVSLKALHEIPHPESALMEAHRVLKEGGKLFIIDWVGGVPQTSSHGHANKYFSPGRLKNALSEAGFGTIHLTLNTEGELMLAEGEKM
jgi:ubiquinone/menaquinone biosynthesis C-methylase UbiE